MDGAEVMEVLRKIWLMRNGKVWRVQPTYKYPIGRPYLLLGVGLPRLDQKLN